MAAPGDRGRAAVRAGAPPWPPPPPPPFESHTASPTSTTTDPTTRPTTAAVWSRRCEAVRATPCARTTSTWLPSPTCRPSSARWKAAWAAAEARAPSSGETGSALSSQSSSCGSAAPSRSGTGSTTVLTGTRRVVQPKLKAVRTAMAASPRGRRCEVWW